MHQIPYLLLDIDGVLVPFPAKDKSTPPTHTCHQVRMTGRPDPVWIWLNHHHGPLIADAISTGLIRPVWCTSWRLDAPGVIGPLLGLPGFEHIELPRVPITTSHPEGYLWKRDHIDAWRGQVDGRAIGTSFIRAGDGDSRSPRARVPRRRREARGAAPPLPRGAAPHPSALASNRLGPRRHWDMLFSRPEHSPRRTRGIRCPDHRSPFLDHRTRR